MRWFEAIIGHPRAKEVLARAVERDRVPPALLLTGRDGSGRCLVATELAKAINCRGSALRQAQGERGDDVTPCGSCAPCKKIQAGTHPDFVRLTPEEGKAALGIDQVRGLLDELALAPVEGKRRVFVIDPADAMTDDAQNALLKALEEPPARAHLILIARHESALLRTIQSRCFVLALGELEASDVEKVLLAKGVAGTGAPMALDEARLRAAWSGGSPGVALGESHLERIASARALIEALATGLARRNPLQVAADLIAKAAPKNAEPALRREGALEVTDLLGRALRDALERAVLDAGGRSEAAHALSGADPKLVARLAQAGADRIAAAIDAVQSVEEAIANNQNMNLALEGLVLDVVACIEPASRAPSQEVARGRH